MCKHVLTLIHANNVHSPADEAIDASILSDVAKIGIVLNTQTLNISDYVSRFSEPCAADRRRYRWWRLSQALFNASDFFEGQLGGKAFGGPGHISWRHIGPAADLGRSVTSVPVIDDRISECLAYVGSQQVRCWTSSTSTPPRRSCRWCRSSRSTYLSVIPKLVVRFSFDQSMSLPAFDQVAVAHTDRWCSTFCCVYQPLR